MEVDNQFHQFIRSRRSIRRFTPEQISRQTLDRILTTAHWAPSAHNRQPWRFVVLRSPEGKTKLAGAMGIEYRRALQAEGLDPDQVERLETRSRERITEAPVVVILCLDRTALDHYDDLNRNHGEEVMGVQSVALAGGTLMLAARAEGLGSVWMCAPLFVPQVVRKVLTLPANWDPQGLILLGQPAQIPDPKPRKPLEEIVRYI